jgi:hypothetical protein
MAGAWRRQSVCVRLVVVEMITIETGNSQAKVKTTGEKRQGRTTTWMT